MLDLPAAVLPRPARNTRTDGLILRPRPPITPHRPTQPQPAEQANKSIQAQSSAAARASNGSAPDPHPDPSSTTSRAVDTTVNPGIDPRRASSTPRIQPHAWTHPHHPLEHPPNRLLKAHPPPPHPSNHPPPGPPEPTGRDDQYNRQPRPAPVTASPLRNRLRPQPHPPIHAQPDLDQSRALSPPNIPTARPTAARNLSSGIPPPRRTAGNQLPNHQPTQHRQGQAQAAAPPNGQLNSTPHLPPRPPRRSAFIQHFRAVV